MTKIYNLCVKTSPYDAKDGKTKYTYLNIGKCFINDDGHPSVLLNKCFDLNAFHPDNYKGDQVKVSCFNQDKQKGDDNNQSQESYKRRDDDVPF